MAFQETRTRGLALHAAPRTRPCDATSLRAPVNSRLESATVYASFALAAGLLQIVATVKLGFTANELLRVVAEHGAWPYVLGTGVTTLAVLVLWAWRRRPVLAAASFLALEIPLLIWLPRRTSFVGLAFHGESFLHHAATILAAATSAAIAWSWWRRTELGPRRLAAIAFVAFGIPILLARHVTAPAHVLPRELVLAATAACLLAAPLGLGLLWSHARPPALKWSAVALTIPLVLRVGLTGPEALLGAPVPESGRSIYMLAVFVAAVLVFLWFRPAAPATIRALVIVLSALATAVLYATYRRAFGELEDGIGGLVQSLFGFPLPYPESIASWRILVFAVAVFCMWSTVYGGILSWNERVRGVALGLMLTTGLGLTNVQLVLMTAAAHLLWLDSLLTPERAVWRAPSTPIDEVLQGLARRLQLADPAVLETASGTVVALRGHVGDRSLDVRARPRSDGSVSLVLKIGERGRGRPEAELVPAPGRGGPRPAHEIGRTHRVLGSMRALEHVGDDTLDALLPFTEAHVRLWAGGSEVELGRDLAALDVDRLNAVVLGILRER